jgi:hypothetical protein
VCVFDLCVRLVCVWCVCFMCVCGVCYITIDLTYPPHTEHVHAFTSGVPDDQLRLVEGAIGESDGEGLFLFVSRENGGDRNLKTNMRAEYSRMVSDVQI